MDHWYVKLFLAVGGAALLWKVVGDGVRAGTKMAVLYILNKFPPARSFAIAHKDRIDALLNEIEAGVDEAIESEAAEDKPVGTSEK